MTRFSDGCLEGMRKRKIEGHFCVLYGDGKTGGGVGNIFRKCQGVPLGQIKFDMCEGHPSGESR